MHLCISILHIHYFYYNLCPADFSIEKLQKPPDGLLAFFLFIHSFFHLLDIVLVTFYLSGTMRDSSTLVIPLPGWYFLAYRNDHIALSCKHFNGSSWLPIETQTPRFTHKTPIISTQVLSILVPLFFCDSLSYYSGLIDFS